MQLVVESLAEGVRAAFDRALETHRQRGEQGKAVTTGRPETRLELVARLAVLTEVAKWCQVGAGRFVRVVIPGGEEREFGNNDAVFHFHLWFSGLLGQDAYLASPTADQIGGYGMTFAIGRGAQPTLNDIVLAGMLRLDTGEWLERNKNGELWHARPGSPAAMFHQRCSGLKASHVILAEPQFHEPLERFNPYHTGSIFGNAFYALTGQGLTIGTSQSYPVAAVGAFGQALPALHYLGRVGDGLLYLPAEHLDRLPVKKAIEHFGHKPQVMATDQATAWEIARALQ